MINIRRNEWFEEWKTKVFTEGTPVIINFEQDGYPGASLEILLHLSGVASFWVLNVNAKDFKFLARTCRKRLGLNGLPDIVAVANNEFVDYIFIKPYHETHPKSICEEIDHMIKDLIEFHLEGNDE